MDIFFHCPHCKQELEADASAAGSIINCPTCNGQITVPQPDPTNVRTGSPVKASAAAREQKQYKVPLRAGAPLIERKKTEEEEEQESPAEKKKLRMRVIRHSDCIEVGVDHYEKVVTDFLNKVGEENIVSITPLSYTHWDMATQKILTDYAVQIIYRK